MFTLEELTEWSGLLLEVQRHRAQPAALVKEKRFLLRLIQKYNLHDQQSDLDHSLVGPALARKRRDARIGAVLGPNLQCD